MFARPSPVRCYCESVFAAACLGVVLIARHLNINFIERRPVAFAVLAGGVLLGEMLPIKVPRGGEDEELTLSSSFALALLVVGGIGPALIAQGAASLLQDKVAGKPFWRQRFNVGQYTLALLFAGAIVSALTVDTPAATADPIASGQVPAMMLAAGAFFVVNTALVGVAVALFRGVPIGRYFRHDPGFLGLTGGVMVLVAPVVLATTLYSVVIVPLCLAPALALYKAISRGARSEHAARHDQLTGLPNRAAFRDAVAEAVKDGRGPGCVLLMDLDRFKEVNDTLGHHTGDVLLAKVAERLLEAAGTDGMVARLGGDEFAVVSGARSLEQAQRLAQRLADSLVAPFELGATVVDVQASIGIALFPAHGSGIDTLLQKADVAMYRAKELRTAVMAYDERHDQNSPDRLSLTAALRTAIQGEEIIVFYQPQLDVRTGEVRAVEALARWHHPERGVIGPASFVGVAERTNLIEPLTNRVMSVALAQVARWRRSGIDLTVAVNISPQVLVDHRFTDNVLAALRAADLPPDRLKLEVTEGALMADPATARAVLLELGLRGVEIAIDDFGTGYSSLAYLADLPVSEIKIDRSFVSRMGIGSSERIIVHSTIDLAHHLGLRTVAEGVSEGSMIPQLQRLGCDVAQGFAISRPLPGDELAAWLIAYQGHASGELAVELAGAIADEPMIGLEAITALENAA